jgi:hypothetical protein
MCDGKSKLIDHSALMLPGWKRTTDEVGMVGSLATRSKMRVVVAEVAEVTIQARAHELVVSSKVIARGLVWPLYGQSTILFETLFTTTSMPSCDPVSHLTLPFMATDPSYSWRCLCECWSAALLLPCRPRTICPLGCNGMATIGEVQQRQYSLLLRLSLRLSVFASCLIARALAVTASVVL